MIYAGIHEKSGKITAHFSNSDVPKFSVEFLSRCRSRQISSSPLVKLVERSRTASSVNIGIVEIPCTRALHFWNVVLLLKSFFEVQSSTEVGLSAEKSPRIFILAFHWKPCVQCLLSLCVHVVFFFILQSFPYCTVSAFPLQRFDFVTLFRHAH